jgi:phenylacetate-CoA ligase
MTQPKLPDVNYATLPREELEQLQIERLQSTLNRVYRNVAFYRSAFDAHRVNLEKITDLAALRELPFTTRQDLAGSYPYGMFAVPLRDIVRIHSTSAAGGQPVVLGYTSNDLRNWTDCTARLLSAAGVNEHDVVQIALDYNMTAGAFGFHQGAQRLGASVIPASATMGIEKQLVIMRDFKTTVLVATPGTAVGLAAGMAPLGLHPGRLNLRLGIFGGERWGPDLRRRIEQSLQITSTDTYGLTEVMGPGVAGECQLHCGQHINEDHFIAEVIDPATLKALPPGQEGELVITTITREGFPLIRYRTGDIAAITIEPCGCGRTFARIGPIAGRTDDRILFHGAAFFPAQIEPILAAVEGTTPHYRVVLDRASGVDTLELRMEISQTIPASDEVRTLETIRAQVAARIKAELGLDARVTFVEPRSLQQSDGGRVEDRRPT